MDIEYFLPVKQFKKNVGNIMRELRNAKKAPNEKRIYTAGEKEYEEYLENSKEGILINRSIQKDIKVIQEELNLNGYQFSF